MHDKKHFSQKTLRAAVVSAVRESLKRDEHLYDVHVHEQCLSHRIAVYLEREFGPDGWHVDCEYNREGSRKKDRPSDDVGVGRRGDIIVHRRGLAGPNLILVETKWAGQDSIQTDMDRIKRWVSGERGDVAREPYQLGAMVVFDWDSSVTVSFWNPKTGSWKDTEKVTKGDLLEGESGTIEDLLNYVKAEGRVCPLPEYWNALWEMLPRKKRVGNGWKPNVPLILGAWNLSSNSEKRLRLKEHLTYAANRGILSDVDSFLRGLSKRDWQYE